MTRAEEVASLLIDVEAQLRQLGLWEAQPPSAEALASTEPFAIDTMNFKQWLQFVFVARLYAMLNTGGSLPGACAITPMAEEYFSGLQLPSGPLLETLAAIDAVLSR